MAYSISTALAIYFVIWWLVLFLTLPFGVRSQHEDGEGAPGTDPGAPMLARMGHKLLWTTLISGVIFAPLRCGPITRAISTSSGCRS